MSHLWILLTFVAGALSAGSRESADMSDPTFHALLDQHYFPQSNMAAEDMQLVSVEKQLVAGINYRGTFEVNGEQCVIQMFYQSWTETVEITADTCSKPMLVTGQWEEGNKDDSAVQNLLEQVYYPGTNVGAEDLDLVRVQHQVVAGTNYKMTFNVVGTNDVCEVVIFEQEWTNTQEVLHDGCTDMVASGKNIMAVDGGWEAADHEDQAIQDLLHEVYYPSSMVSDGDLEVLGAEKQIVAGVNYRVYFNVAGSGQQCHVTFFTQEWTNTRTVMEDTCEEAVAQATLMGIMPGGFMPQDPTDPAFHELLENTYYPQSALGAEDMTLVSVETQVVAGINYRYTFQMKGSDALCHVMIFDQPWSNTQSVTMDTCEAMLQPVLF